MFVYLFNRLNSGTKVRPFRTHCRDNSEPYGHCRRQCSQKFTSQSVIVI